MEEDQFDVEVTTETKPVDENPFYSSYEALEKKDELEDPLKEERERIKAEQEKDEAELRKIKESKTPVPVFEAVEEEDKVSAPPTKKPKIEIGQMSLGALKSMIDSEREKVQKEMEDMEEKTRQKEQEEEHKKKKAEQVQELQPLPDNLESSGDSQPTVFSRNLQPGTPSRRRNRDVTPVKKGEENDKLDKDEIDVGTETEEISRKCPKSPTKNLFVRNTDNPKTTKFEWVEVQDSSQESSEGIIIDKETGDIDSDFLEKVEEIFDDRN